MFGFTATWNYFEAGHGKGPCDGGGGTTKHLAERTVNSGQQVKQYVEDFYNWLYSVLRRIGNNSTM